MEGIALVTVGEAVCGVDVLGVSEVLEPKRPRISSTVALCCVEAGVDVEVGAVEEEEEPKISARRSWLCGVEVDASGFDVDTTSSPRRSL